MQVAQERDFLRVFVKLEIKGGQFIDCLRDYDIPS
jgi:hypothetical protein